MTPNEIIGSLVYRTNNALNNNASFLEKIKAYRYYPAITHDEKLHLWHFPGTNQEISQVFKTLSGNSLNGSELKFPAVINFQSVMQEHELFPGITVNRYNLAIIAPVLDTWTTQQREAQVYKLVLKPIEDELIRQIGMFRHFQKPVGRFPYKSVYVPTTGHSLNSVMKMQYGDFLDAIELPNLSIKVLETCESMSNIIIEENKKVTDEIINIIRK